MDTSTETWFWVGLKDASNSLPSYASLVSSNLVLSSELLFQRWSSNTSFRRHCILTSASLSFSRDLLVDMLPCPSDPATSALVLAWASHRQTLRPCVEMVESEDAGRSVVSRRCTKRVSEIVESWSRALLLARQCQRACERSMELKKLSKSVLLFEGEEDEEKKSQVVDGWARSLFESAFSACVYGPPSSPPVSSAVVGRQLDETCDSQSSLSTTHAGHFSLDTKHSSDVVEVFRAVVAIAERIETSLRTYGVIPSEGSFSDSLTGYLQAAQYFSIPWLSSVYDDLLQSDMEHRNLEGDRSGEWNPDSILSQLVEEFSSVSQSSRNRQQMKEINKWKVYWTQLQQLPVYHLDSTMFPRPCISLISIQSPTSSSEFHTDSELPTFLQDTKISSSRRQIFCADI